MKNIPFATIERVARYLRCLKRLGEMKIKVVSSKALAEHTKTTPEQVRKDLSYFGKFGKTGTGYDVKKLSKKLEAILKAQKKWNVCIIGAGALGSALVRYPGFKESGYSIIAMFDNNLEKIGKKISGIEIFDIEKFSEITRKKDIQLAIAAVPKESTEELEDVIAKSTIRGVMNFVPVTLKFKTRRRIAVVDVDLAQKLYIMTYLIKRGKGMK